ALSSLLSVPSFIPVSARPREPHSFPTRRSSDLLHSETAAALAGQDFDWELVFVDDGSTDGSYRELVRLHAAYTHIRVVRLRRNLDRKSTRLNSSHQIISYAVFCLKKQQRQSAEV